MLLLLLLLLLSGHGVQDTMQELCAWNYLRITSWYFKLIPIHYMVSFDLCFERSLFVLTLTVYLTDR